MKLISPETDVQSDFDAQDSDSDDFTRDNMKEDQRTSKQLYEQNVQKQNDKFSSKDKWDESIFIRSKNSHNNSGLKFF